MKRSYILCLLALLLLLAGCKGEPALTPTPAPTPVPVTGEPVSTLELEVEEGLRSFWIELVPVGELGDLRVDVYREKGDGEPFQSFEETIPNYMLTSMQLTAEDVNFDGCADFHFQVNTNSQGDSWSHYYVWSGTKFIPDPYGLNDLPSLHFGWGRVTSLRQSVPKGMTSYAYENSSLVQTGEVYAPGGEEFLEAYALRRFPVDGENILWIRIVPTGEGEEGRIPVRVTLTREGEEEPLQMWEDTYYSDSFEWMRLTVEDLDFDGCPDVGYTARMGDKWGGMAYWLWDPEAERLVRDPYGLEELSMPGFGPEKRVVETWNYSGGDSETEYYRYYQNDKGERELTCVRRLLTRGDAETFTATLTVEDYDYAAGGLTEVYRAENVPDGVVTWPSTREFQRWKDPDYNGGQALGLDVGDGKHSFWIEAEPGDWLNEFEKGVTLSIYREELDEEPVRVIETATMAPDLFKLESVDADFDGDMDFYFPCNVGATNGFYSFWLWDGETETFVEDHSGLGSLSYPRFDEEEKRIYSHMHGSATSGTDSIYAWRAGELVCLRSVYHAVSLNEASVDVVVWDEGQRTVEKTYPSGSDWSRWLDLSYHGE